MKVSQRLLALSCLTLLGWNASVGAIDGAGIRSFTVESEPSGAEVVTIKGHQGTTPLTLDERDIYPNSYPPEKTDQYGMVTLRKSGCREMNIRPSDSDIANGLSLELDCGRAASAGSNEARSGNTAGSVPQAEQAESNSRESDAVASKKLEQLRFLQELLDDGLITAEEEATIRKRILEQP